MAQMRKVVFAKAGGATKSVTELVVVVVVVVLHPPGEDGESGALPIQHVEVSRAHSRGQIPVPHLDSTDGGG